MKKGDKALVGNSAYRRYLRKIGKAKDNRSFEIDAGKLAEEARFDGIFVLRTNAKVTPLQAVLRYRDLLQVENLFLRTKAIMRTRPIFHSSDAAIRGHVFCSFLALAMQKHLDDILCEADVTPEWKELLRDLDRLQNVRLEHRGPIGWCARTRPETSRLCSVTLISGCHRVPGKPRLRRLHHRHRPTNAAVAQSVVPRRLEFRRNSHEIRDLQKLTVRVGRGDWTGRKSFHMTASKGQSRAGKSERCARPE